MSVSHSRKPASRYDVIIAGGGILGATLAWECTLRGAKVLLLERNDYGSGASANSLKIIHGGLRYLQTGNLRRARRSASEQTLLLSMAPHLVRPLSCVVPTGQGFARSRSAYGFGLGFYHRIIKKGLSPLSGDSAGYGLLSRGDLAENVPLADYPNASGGAWWQDAQVHDPVRLVLEFIQAAQDLGADCLNYMEVSDCKISSGSIAGVRVCDRIVGDEWEIGCSLLLDATGTGVPNAPVTANNEPGWCTAVNLGLDLQPGEYAFGIDAPVNGNREKRFLFLKPWNGSVTAGTWYFPGSPSERDALTLGEDQLAQCLEDVNAVLSVPVDKSTVLYADIGRLPTSGGAGPVSASLLDKDMIHDGTDHGVDGYIRAIGVKYTTARRFAEDIVDSHVRKVVPLTARQDVSLPGAQYDGPEALTSFLRSRLPHETPGIIVDELVQRYGSRAVEIVELMISEASCRDFVPTTSTTVAELTFVCEAEQVEKAIDVIARRTSMGSLGCPSGEAIDFVLEHMSSERGWDSRRIKSEREEIKACYARLP